MKANTNFINQPKEFWAHVKTISQEVGYTDRSTGAIKIPTLTEIRDKFARVGLTAMHLQNDNELTPFGIKLLHYFTFRADILNSKVQHLLMDKDAAEKEFLTLKENHVYSCPLPMNKQTGDKKNYAFLTCIVNMLIESSIKPHTCDYDPRGLTTLTNNSQPFRTLSRRVDGAFPSIINPAAIWEIKEYYYTKTFGSRVADGVYETLLDGLELEELFQSSGRKVEHILFIDDHFTWWKCGRSYLCRMIDMLHMGYVDEIIFGREVLTRLPIIASQWIKAGPTSRCT